MFGCSRKGGEEKNHLVLKIGRKKQLCCNLSCFFFYVPEIYGHLMFLVCLISSDCNTLSSPGQVVLV